MSLNGAFQRRRKSQSIFLPRGMHWVFVASFFSISTADFFTATASLEELPATAQATVTALDQYLEAEHERLERVKNLKDDLEALCEMAERDSEFILNPINAFLLVKKLSMDFKVVNSTIFYPKSPEVIRNLTDEVRFPNDEDLDGAAIGLLRLQDVYALDTSQVANGILTPGANESPQLTADDCFELGRQSYVASEFNHTVSWMKEALERLHTTRNNPDEVEMDILDYWASAAFKLGNIRHAVELTDQILAKRPDHATANEDRSYFLSELEKQEGLISNERLCRGEFVEKRFLRKELHCKYFHNYHPYMLLQPAKLEIVHEQPYLAIFHDIMSDDEIRTVINLGAPRLERAGVEYSGAGPNGIVNFRISKNAWLENSDHEVVNRLTLRFEYLTGLTRETAEELQVANYGIGGHYTPHWDFLRRRGTGEIDLYGYRDRIATWISYLSDVRAGGATVFPELGLTIWPEKGSAAFWWNLHKNGEPDYLTKHAACPVLAGSKWVSNLWFHEMGQDFRRPCGLNSTD